jgi:hypothetical protein
MYFSCVFILNWTFIILLMSMYNFLGDRVWYFFYLLNKIALFKQLLQHIELNCRNILFEIFYIRNILWNKWTIVLIVKYMTKFKTHSDKDWRHVCLLNIEKGMRKQFSSSKWLILYIKVII